MSVFPVLIGYESNRIGIIIFTSYKIDFTVELRTKANAKRIKFGRLYDNLKVIILCVISALIQLCKSNQDQYQKVFVQ